MNYSLLGILKSRLGSLSHKMFCSSNKNYFGKPYGMSYAKVIRVPFVFIIGDCMEKSDRSPVVQQLSCAQHVSFLSFMNSSLFKNGTDSCCASQMKGDVSFVD